VGAATAVQDRPPVRLTRTPPAPPTAMHSETLGHATESSAAGGPVGGDGMVRRTGGAECRGAVWRGVAVSLKPPAAATPPTARAPITAIPTSTRRLRARLFPSPEVVVIGRRPPRASAPAAVIACQRPGSGLECRDEKSPAPASLTVDHRVQHGGGRRPHLGSPGGRSPP
jgi:hypothetical protein